VRSKVRIDVRSRERSVPEGAPWKCHLLPCIQKFTQITILIVRDILYAVIGILASSWMGVGVRG
jgi:hypothetical protein